MIVPEMIGSVVGVYNGKQYINVEIKPEMIGHYLAEVAFACHLQRCRGVRCRRRVDRAPQLTYAMIASSASRVP